MILAPKKTLWNQLLDLELKLLYNLSNLKSNCTNWFALNHFLRIWIKLTNEMVQDYSNKRLSKLYLISYFCFLVHLIQKFAFISLFTCIHSSRKVRIENKFCTFLMILKKKIGQMARTNKVVKIEAEMSQLFLLLASSNQSSEQAL